MKKILEHSGAVGFQGFKLPSQSGKASSHHQKKAPDATCASGAMSMV